MKSMKFLLKASKEIKKIFKKIKINYKTLRVEPNNFSKAIIINIKIILFLMHCMALMVKMVKFKKY